MKQKFKDSEKKNILILGGGYAGVRAALDLNQYLKDNDEYEIILIDRKDFHLYTSALYEAATTEHRLVEAKKVKRTVGLPFAEIFGKTKVKVYKAYIDNISLDDGMVVTDSRILNYNYLIIAMGSIADFYGIPSIEKYGFTLKSLEDAIMIRNRVESIVSKKETGRIVIGGGGYTGAEFAGELHNLIKHECEFHQKKLENFEVMIVEGATGLLPGLPENVSKQVADRLGKQGIKTKFSTLITEAGSDFVMLNKTERLACDLLIWTGGVRSCPMPGKLDLERDKKDRVAASDYLNLKKHPNVFIAGDNLCFIDPVTKKPLPQTAQEAIRHGRLIGRNVYRMIMRKDLAVYHPGPLRFIVPVSGKYAVFYSKDLFISGFFGWVIRRMADLRYFLGVLPFFTAVRFWMFENKIFIKND